MVLCDGGYSRLRNVNVGEKPQPKGHFVGFEHEGQLDTPGRLVMLVTDNGFAYVYGISPTTSRFIIDIEGPMPKQPKEYFKDLIKQFPGRKCYANTTPSNKISGKLQPPFLIFLSESVKVVLLEVLSYTYRPILGYI